MPKITNTKRSALAAKRPWQLQEAKAQFSELFRRAQAEGPQYVTRQGKDTVVVLTVEEFERLAARTRQPRDLVQFFAESPLTGVDLDLERPRDVGRKVRL
jgi:antitoxin Phd